jgi:hypothetical protein
LNSGASNAAVFIGLARTLCGLSRRDELPSLPHIVQLLHVNYGRLSVKWYHIVFELSKYRWMKLCECKRNRRKRGKQEVYPRGRIGDIKKLRNFEM